MLKISPELLESDEEREMRKLRAAIAHRALELSMKREENAIFGLPLDPALEESLGACVSALDAWPDQDEDDEVPTVPVRETMQAALTFLRNIEFAGAIWTDCACCTGCGALKRAGDKGVRGAEADKPEPHKPDCEWLMTVNDLEAALAALP